MDPWKERFSTPAVTTTTTTKICANYPQCAKEERKCLNELRAAGALGQPVPNNFKLSNGVRATDFSLQFLMKSHCQRKNSSS
jgi:hypothetical protein